MESMTTDDKLLAQDDIDALLGEAGLEGSYESEKNETLPVKKEKNTPIKFVKKSYSEARESLEILFKQTFLERKDDVNVIWNAFGNIPMATGLQVNIQGKEYVSLGILHEKHLVVKAS